jgi:flagellar protein FlgJ
MTAELDSVRTYTDFQGLARLRSAARQDSPEALPAVAQEFEAVFIQMMLKSMRATEFGSDLFNTDAVRFYRDLFDQQISIELAKRGDFGLADVLVKQLEDVHEDQRATDAELFTGLLVNGSAATRSPDRVVATTRPVETRPVDAPLDTVEDEIHIIGPETVEAKDLGFASAEEFVAELSPHAAEAAKKLGVNPTLLLAQAALETGWGRRIIRGPDGLSSYNLFNIKADRDWSGDRVTVTALEYQGGVARRVPSAFRAYDSYAHSLRDYVEFIRTQPRYAHVLKVAGDPRHYIQALHTAGYATDPDYPSKVLTLMQQDVFSELKIASARP